MANVPKDGLFLLFGQLPLLPQAGIEPVSLPGNIKVVHHRHANLDGEIHGKIPQHQQEHDLE